jgi:hypothetical protein
MSKAKSHLSATQKSINRRIALMGAAVLSAAASLPLAKAARGGPIVSPWKPSREGQAIIAACLRLQADTATDSPTDAALEASSACMHKVADPATAVILARPVRSLSDLADLAIAAAHECDVIEGNWFTREDGAGTKALIAAVLELAGVNPIDCLIDRP